VLPTPAGKRNKIDATLFVNSFAYVMINEDNEFLFSVRHLIASTAESRGGDSAGTEKENGQYQFQGNNLTVTPKEGVTEEWLKVNSFDEYGDFKSSSPRTLEKTTYTINSHHFSGSGETAIIFQSNQPTVRDGKPSTVGGFTDAWAYYPLTKTSDLIVLPATRKK
jgi:hypothetical protein